MNIFLIFFPQNNKVIKREMFSKRRIENGENIIKQLLETFCKNKNYHCYLTLTAIISCHLLFLENTLSLITYTPINYRLI